MANIKRRKKKPKSHIKKPRAKPKQKMPWWKTALIVLMSIMIIGGIGIDAWWIYIYKFGPDKVVSNTYEVGLQTIESGDTAYFMELNYWKNSDNAGYEMFELKFNYMLDENNSAFYSQGLQFIGKTQTDKVRFEHQYAGEQDKISSSGWWIFNGERHFNVFDKTINTAASGRFNYASSDNYTTTILSANPLSYESSFKVLLGEDNFLMKFNKKATTTANNIKNIDDWSGWLDWYHHYSYVDSDFLASLLYNSVQSLNAGTDMAIAIEFGDLFDWYEYDSDSGTYSETSMHYEDSVKVIADFKTYYSIKVNIHESGAKNAKTDSIFKTMFGNQNFVLSGSESQESYFLGRTVIDVTMDNLVLVETAEVNKFKVKLNDKFNSAFAAYKDVIVLDVQIDLDWFEENGITYAGTADNAFGIFQIYRIVTVGGE